MSAGYAEPKPIQIKAIPAQLAGRDILGVAQTGSGKTAAFALPILSKIIALGNKRRPKTARALILAPTRELAVQIDESFRMLAKGAHVSTALVLGGVSRFSQVKKIAPGVDVLIATPGRLTDLVREKDVILSETTLAGPRRGRPHARHGLHQRRQAACQGDASRRARPRCFRPPCRRRSSSWRKACCAIRCASRSRRRARRPPRSPRASSWPHQAEAPGAGHHARRRGDDVGADVLAHQAWRRPHHPRPRARRLQRRRHPWQQVAERPPEGAQRLPRRLGAHSRRHRHRGARHRRARASAMS